MEGEHDTIAPIPKTKNSVVNKEEFVPRLATKPQADNIELTVFKGTNPSFTTDIAKVVIRYTH